MIMRAVLVAAAVGVFVPWFVGCSKKGPERFDIWGSVIHQGMPIKVGSITFDPEAHGVGGGMANILDGRYDTRQLGRGHLGGMHTVLIVGSDGTLKDPNDPDKGVVLLFPPYQTTVELPKSSGELDFNVE